MNHRFNSLHTRGLAVGRESLRDYLIHVVVLVCCQTTDEMHVRCRIRQLLVTCIQLSVLFPRHRIVFIALRLRKLVNNARLRVLLPGEILELRHPSVELLVRIVDDRRGLINRYVVRFVLEFKRSVRQFSVTIIEIRINGTSIDHLAEGNIFLDFPVIAIQHDLDIGVIKHVLKHAREAVQWHRLVRISEVTIVAVGSRRNSRRHTRVKLGRIESPLFARIIAEKFFVQLSSHFADYNVLRRLYTLDGFSDFLEKLLDFKRRQAQTVESVDRVEIDRNGNDLAVNTRAYAMLIRPPFGKPRKIVKD